MKTALRLIVGMSLGAIMATNASAAEVKVLTAGAF